MRAAEESARNSVRSKVISVTRILLAIACFSCRRRGHAIDTLVRAADALPERATVGRLSGGFAYRRLAVLKRGPHVASADLGIMAAAAELSDAARRDGSADAMHRAGESYLIAGKASEAVDALEESLLRETGARDLPSAIAQTKNADTLSDLAASYLARMAGEDTTDSLAAMNTAERAWQLAQTPEVAWNRALALSAASSREAALGAWRDVLAIDPASQWSAEGRQRMDAVAAKGPPSREEAKNALTAALASADDAAVLRAAALSSGYARLFIEDELLPKWGSGDENAFRDARRLSDAVAKVSGDFVDADSLARIGAIRGSGAEGENEIRKALVGFGQGRKALAGYHYDDALPLMTEAEARLRLAGLPLSKRAAVFVATLHFYAHRAGMSLALCDDVVRANNPTRYPSVEAQCRWNEGTIETGRRNFDRAKEAFEDARRLFAGMTDLTNVAALDVRLEENDRCAGEVRNAWSHMTSALRNGAAERGYIPLSEAAKVAEAATMPFAALAFYDSAISAARAARSAAEQTDGSLSRARLLRKLGREDEALAELNTATRLMATIGDRTVAARLNSYLVVARGELTVARQPAKVATEMEAVVAEMKATDNRRNVAVARCLQAKANLALGKRADAENSLRAALAELETQRAAISTDEERIALLDTAREAAEMLVALLFDSRRTYDALRAAEGAKAQLLLDAVGGQGNACGDIASPATSEAFIDYFVLPDRLLVWSITASETRAHVIAVDRRDLERSVAEWQSALDRADDGAIRERGAELFGHLLRPVWPEIESCPKLVFAADGFLYHVPFSALPDPRNTFLVDDYDVSNVPSLTWLAAGARRPNDIPRHVVAAIASQNADERDAYYPLPAAEQDGRAIAARFPGATLLTGGDASPPRVAAAAREADLFHFAGHAIVDEVRPGRSALIMSGGQPWRASAIAHQKLARAPIVVLAACSTGAGRVTSDGTASIARAFLLAGSRAAVATLWPVSDDAAAEISGAFYRSLVSGGGARAALCAAQRAAIHRSNSRGRYDWAAFQFIGS